MSDPVEFYRWAQRRLAAHGATIAADGQFGPLSQQALKRFQRSQGLLQDGRLTRSTVIALRRDPGGRDSGAVKLPVVPPWLAEAERRLGLHEVRDRSALMAWLRSDGRTLGDPAKLPWCGDFVETCIRLALPEEPVPAIPYLARNWLAFGERTTPRLGAVTVFWRGSREGTSGHVGLYLRESRDAVEVIGGNQQNAVTKAWLSKDRVLGYRRPRTFSLDTTAVAVAISGPLSSNEA